MRQFGIFVEDDLHELNQHLANGCKVLSMCSKNVAMGTSNPKQYKEGQILVILQEAPPPMSRY